MINIRKRLTARPGRTGAAVLSGLILWSAYPPLEWADAAWVAFIPLLLAVRGLPVKAAFRLGMTAGAVFWLMSIYWIGYVTIPGMTLLALYCALYTGFFAAGAARLTRVYPLTGWLLLPILWAALEYIRSVFATGFSWNTLAVSQYKNLPIIQMASRGGVYAVSFCIMFMNAMLAATIQRYVARRGHWGRRPHGELMAGLTVLAVWFAVGVHDLRRPTEVADYLHVALIQPNTRQHLKWSDDDLADNRARIARLSRAAAAAGQPDLVIHPETVFPDFLRDSEEDFAIVVETAAAGPHVLTGALDYEWGSREHPRTRYYNTAFLIGPGGKFVQQYDKQHLVIFGEYIPLETVFPFLRTFTPIDGSFTAGKTSTVFRVKGVPFASLICFEDTVPRLARRAFNNGARMLVNQTNDAWFDPSCGSRQHLAQSVFRAVENGIPLVRCANTGASGWIDEHGRIQQVLTGADGQLQTAGFLHAEIPIPPDSWPPTFYTRHGDVFAVACLLIAMVTMGLTWIVTQRKRKFIKQKARPGRDECAYANAGKSSERQIF